MKKLVLTFAIVLGMTLCATAQDGAGIFKRGHFTEQDRTNGGDQDPKPLLPQGHGLETDQDATGPVGTGLALLAGFGAAYLIGKKRREE